MAMEDNESGASSRGVKSKDQQFPVKLYEMLQAVERLDLSHTVCWLPHGQSFQVKDPVLFMKSVVPQFFKATKYRSFQRQLNLWGFNRIAKGEDNPSWHHEHFIRGRPELLHKIRRNRVKATQGNSGPRATSKPKALVQTTSDDSSDGASDYIEDISVNESATRAGGYEYSSANANEMMRRVRTAIPNDASAFFEDKVFDEKLNSMFSERTSSQNSGYAKIELMRLEPLPIHCAGILDSTDTRNNNDLAAFGQLLDRL